MTRRALAPAGFRVIGGLAAGAPGISGVSRVIALSAFAALMFLPGCAGREGRPGPFENMALSVAYVGREACVECHGGIAQSYAATGMGRSFYPLTSETAVEDFVDENVVELPADALRYVMSERAGRYYMKQVVTGLDGEEVVSVEKQIVYVVGSGNHSRSYLTAREGRYDQMPVCWYPGKPGWDLCPGYELANQHFDRAVDDSCLFCHNARMPKSAGAKGAYAAKVPHGIDCERCHGPGELHVGRWKAPRSEPKGRDTTILNPIRLPGETRMQVCLQCHLGDADSSERVKRRGKNPEDFRPGNHVADFIEVFAFDPPMEGRFGLGSQGDRLMLSRCYQASGGGLDCLNCHDPHVPVASAGESDRRRRACLGCHDSGGCSLSEGVRRERSGGDDCAGCHMRRAEPADQRFTTFTDHWIRRRIEPPSPPETARADARLVPINLKPGAPRDGSESRFNAAVASLGKKSGGVNGPLIPWSEPEGLLRDSIASDPGFADAWYYLGRSALKQGRLSESIGHFRETLRVAPEHRNARLNLAAVLLTQERPEESASILRGLLAVDPLDTQAMSDLSRAMVMLHREEEAQTILDRALALDPDEPTLLANAGLLAAKRGRHEEAVDRLRLACALAPSQAATWDALAASLLDLGRSREALSAARRAVDLAPALPTAHKNLGRALALSGDLVEAESALRTAVALRPADAEARLALKALAVRKSRKEPRS